MSEQAPDTAFEEQRCYRKDRTSGMNQSPAQIAVGVELVALNASHLAVSGSVQRKGGVNGGSSGCGHCVTAPGKHCKPAGSDARHVST